MRTYRLLLYLITSFLLAPLAANGEASANICPQGSLHPGKIVVTKTTTGLSTSVMEYGQATNIMEYLKSLSEIPYKYVVDGCDVRALMGAKSLYEDWGVKTMRINIDEASGELIVETPYTLEGYVTFDSRHSAIAICASSLSSAHIQPLILDPAFANRPLTYPEWIHLIRDGEVGRQKVFFSSMFNLDPYSRRSEQTFSAEDLACVSEVAAAFREEERKIESARSRSDYPIGVGKAKEKLRLNMCND